MSQTPNSSQTVHQLRIKHLIIWTYMEQSPSKYHTLWKSMGYIREILFDASKQAQASCFLEFTIIFLNHCSRPLLSDYIKTNTNLARDTCSLVKLSVKSSSELFFFSIPSWSLKPFVYFCHQRMPPITMSSPLFNSLSQFCISFSRQDATWY